MASEGDTVEVGQVIATVGEGSGNASSSKEESSDQSQSANNDEANKESAQPKESQSNNEEKHNLILTINVLMQRHQLVAMHVKTV